MDRDQREAVTRHYDERAATYDDGPIHRALAEAVADLVRSLPAGGRRPVVVLDVATGTGLVLRALAGPEVLGIGLDLSPGMLQVATAASGIRTGYLRADAIRLPLPDASVDVVTCITALHLLPDAAAADAAIAEWRRVLRPDGHVVTATFAATNPADTTPAAATLVTAPGPAAPRRRHEDYGEPGQLAAAFARHALSLVRHRTWADPAHPQDHLLLCVAAPTSTSRPASQ